MSKTEIALEKFKQGYNCAQSVLFSYGQDLGIGNDMALRIANGFGGGMGRKQNVCGAVSGAVMVLGLMYGRGEFDDKQKQEMIYEKVRELIDSFEGRYGTINCKELLDGCDLMTQEGQKQFGERGLIARCYAYVESVIEAMEVMRCKAGSDPA